jgi:caffeoyl-CoA O-methyltransferase
MRYVAMEYSERLSAPLPPDLRELIEQTYALEGRRADMISGSVQGAFLQTLVATSGAGRVLELGTYTGFTALMMAAALPPDGELVTCESDPRRASVARGHFERSPYGGRIRLLPGRAEDSLATLEPGFDLIFVDVGPETADAVYDRLIALIAPKGLIVIDNVLARGAAVDLRNERGKTADALNRRIFEDDRVTQVMLTVRDGLMLVRRASGNPR